MLIKPKWKEANPALPVWPATTGELNGWSNKGLIHMLYLPADECVTWKHLPQQMLKEMQLKRGTEVWLMDGNIVIHQYEGGFPQTQLQ